jgi:hypothetical protein
MPSTDHRLALRYRRRSVNAIWASISFYAGLCANCEWPTACRLSCFRRLSFIMTTMVDSQLHAELVKQLDHLSLPQQQWVLEYARSLLSSSSTPRGRGIPGAELPKFAGTISPEDCKKMMDAINAGCEHVD